jgi:hypothetical protein
MFQRLSNGWQLAKASWEVLKLDKEMLLFPAISGLACLLVMASFALPLVGTDYLQTVTEEQTAPQDPVAYVILFAFYFVNYFVIVFFNSALVACAIIRFRGGDPTVADGFRAAFSRLPQIAGWAFVSASVGVILRIIESRSERAGQFISGLLGMGWSAITFLVIPVMVIEKVGPFTAIKRSLELLRNSWGEALGANFGIGLIVFVAIIVSMVPALLGFLSGSAVAIGIGIAVSALLIILISLISSALNVIILGALYEYASDKHIPLQFDSGQLEDAFAPRSTGGGMFGRY